MKYETGDDIIVLHTNEEGKVVEIINNKMVMVKVSGVKFPVYTDQIDFPYFKRFTEKKIVPEKSKQYIDNIPQEKKNIVETAVKSGVWLALVPKFSFDELDDEIVELFKIYLINHTPDDLAFGYRQQFLNETNFELNNTISAGKDFYLHDLPFDDLNNSPSFLFAFSLLKSDKKKAELHETQLKLRPKQVFKKTEEIKAKNEPVISYLLFENYPDKTVEETSGFEPANNRTKTYKIEEAHRYIPAARSVIDLHIEKLTGEWSRLTPFEMLTLQLREFEKWYHIAVLNYQPTLVVIHGIGTGRLKEEIHTILKLKKEVKTFVNQYDPRFGYGATEIFFAY
jgi:hypothetical protein